MSKTKNEQPATQAHTTIRATVTPYEHAVVQRTAKVKHGMTIDEFVRMAVSRQLEATTGNTLADLADAEAKRGRIVQEELF